MFVVVCADVCDGWCVQERVEAGGCRCVWRSVLMCGMAGGCKCVCYAGCSCAMKGAGVCGGGLHDV
jgi:hypothetical protein